MKEATKKELAIALELASQDSFKPRKNLTVCPRYDDRRGFHFWQCDICHDAHQHTWECWQRFYIWLAKKNANV